MCFYFCICMPTPKIRENNNFSKISMYQVYHDEKIWQQQLTDMSVNLFIKWGKFQVTALSQRMGVVH